MKAYEIMADRKKDVIAQLERYECYDNEGYTYKELLIKLQVAKAMEVDISNPSNKYF